jgi:hypothetical protein
MKNSILVVMLLAAAGCASSRAAEKGPAGTGAASATGDREPNTAADAMTQGMCPMAVPGTSVAAQDTPQGEALTFTTSSGDVNELRQRVRAMADMHNRHPAGRHGAGEMSGEMHGTGAGSGQSMTDGEMHAHQHKMMPPPARATVEDVPGGARIDLVPQESANAEQLRQAVRTQAERMRRDGCGGMRGM